MKVFVQQLLYFGGAVRISPLADRLHGHIFTRHFTPVDQHFTNTAISVTVFTGIAEEHQRTAIAIIHITAALHFHHEVIHQGVGPGHHIVVAQRTGIDRSTIRQTPAFWRHTV